MAPLSEEHLTRLFGELRADIDSEPFAHEDTLAVAIAAAPGQRPVSLRLLAAGLAGLLLLVSAVSEAGSLLGWW